MTDLPMKSTSTHLLHVKTVQKCHHLGEREEQTWMNLTFDVKENKTLCKPHGETITGKNTINLKWHLKMSHPTLPTLKCFCF